jgi:hypothetical protein
MALIFNATNETQTVKAMGNWVTFKPKQIKLMQENLASFLATERADYGLVAVPDAFEDPEYKDTPEGAAKLQAYEQQGIDAHVAHLRRIIYNNQVSLRQDLEKADMKVDPATLATDAELEAMKLVANYQKDKDDRAQKRADEVRELMKSVGPLKK